MTVTITVAVRTVYVCVMKDSLETTVPYGGVPATVTNRDAASMGNACAMKASWDQTVGR